MGNALAEFVNVDDKQGSTEPGKGGRPGASIFHWICRFSAAWRPDFPELRSEI
jgi:hypothetical protein